MTVCHSNAWNTRHLFSFSTSKTKMWSHKGTGQTQDASCFLPPKTEEGTPLPSRLSLHNPETPSWSFCRWAEQTAQCFQLNRSYSNARLCVLTIGSAGGLCGLMQSCIYFCWMCQYNCEGTVPVGERNRSLHLSLSSTHCREHYHI